MISRARLRRYLSYNPKTGKFTWLVRNSPRVKIGDTAGSPAPGWYTRINIDTNSYLAHRLAFVYMTGRCPKYVDHIDGNKANNKWSNLREATITQNAWNSKSHGDSTSRFKGVSWNKVDKKWRAQISIDGHNTFLGLFVDARDAAKAYQDAARKHHGEFSSR